MTELVSPTATTSLQTDKGAHRSPNHADADRSSEGEVMLSQTPSAQKFVFAVTPQW